MEEGSFVFRLVVRFYAATAILSLPSIINDPGQQQHAAQQQTPQSCLMDSI